MIGEHLWGEFGNAVSSPFWSFWTPLRAPGVNLKKRRVPALPLPLPIMNLSPFLVVLTLVYQAIGLTIVQPSNGTEWTTTGKVLLCHFPNHTPFVTHSPNHKDPTSYRGLTKQAIQRTSLSNSYTTTIVLSIPSRTSWLQMGLSSLGWIWRVVWSLSHPLGKFASLLRRLRYLQWNGSDAGSPSLPSGTGYSLKALYHAPNGSYTFLNVSQGVSKKRRTPKPIPPLTLFHITDIQHSSCRWWVSM